MSVCQNISQTEWKWSIPKFFNIGEACSDRVCKEGKKDKIAMIEVIQPNPTLCERIL